MTENAPWERAEDPLVSIETEESELTGRLYDERPVPAPNFRGELRRQLTTASGNRESSVGFSPRVLIAGYLSSGLLLLAVALAGVAGAGPFGA